MLRTSRHPTALCCIPPHPTAPLTSPHYTSLHLTAPFHCLPSLPLHPHCISLNRIASHCTSLHHRSSHCTSLDHITPHCTSLHHNAPYCTSLHPIAPHCTTTHLVAPHCASLHRRTPHCTSLHHITLHCTSLLHIAPYCTLLHLIASQCTSLYLLPPHRQMNQHLCDSVVGFECGLPAQITPFLKPANPGRTLRDTIVGGNSFGYSGTIAHVLLQAAAHCSASAPQAPLALARIAFLWREHLHPLAQRLLPIMDREVFRSPAAGPLHSAVSRARGSRPSSLPRCWLPCNGQRGSA